MGIETCTYFNEIANIPESNLNECYVEGWARKMKMRLMITAVSVLIIAGLVYLCIINRFEFTKTSWQKVNGNISKDNDERLLTTKDIYNNNRVDYQILLFLHGDTIRLYSSINKDILLQEFTLPGKFQSYKADTLRDSKNLYFTVSNNGKSKLVIYEYKDSLYKILSIIDTDDYKTIEYYYTKPDAQSSDKTLALISEDRCRVKLFEPPYNAYFEFKHDKPFKLAHYGINFVFDSDSIFNIYKPEETKVKFDYSGIKFDSSLLNLNKLLDINDGWFYNNGYLVEYNLTTYKASSVTKIGDAIYIGTFKTDKASDDNISGYFYITKDGIFKTDLKNTHTLLPAHDLNNEHIIYGGEYSFELYTMSDGPNTKFISVKTTRDNDYKFEELGITPGKYLGAFVEGGYIYAYTTEGVFRNYYPHLDYLDLRKHP